MKFFYITSNCHVCSKRGREEKSIMNQNNGWQYRCITLDSNYKKIVDRIKIIGGGKERLG